MRLDPTTCLALILVCCTAPLSGQLSAQSPAKPKPPKALAGYWQSVKKSKGAHTVVRFVDAKFQRAYKDGFEAFPVRYETDTKMTVYYHGMRLAAEAVVVDDKLTFSGAGYRKPQVFARLLAEPKDFEPVAMPLGKAKKLSRKIVRKVQNELLKRESRDQAARNGSNEKKIAALDAANTKFLIKAVAQHGWIDVDRFGLPAANAAWLLTTHSGHLPLMLAALPEIRRDVDNKKLSTGQNYANLFDRVQMHLGEKQRFGTQISTNASGQYVVYPVVDRAKLNALRKELRMDTIEAALALQKQWMGGATPKFDDFE